MAEERIEELISKEALDQFSKLKDLADANVASFEKLIAKGVEINNTLGKAKGFKDVTSATKDLSENEKALTKQVDELAKANAKLQSAYTEQAKKIAEVKVQQQARNKELATEAKLSSESTSAYDKLVLTLDKLKKQYKDLVSIGQENTETGKQLKAQIDVLQPTFEKANKSVKDFRFNVGNYNESANLIVEALSKAQTKFDGLNRSADASPAAIKAAGRELDALKRITDSPQFMNVAFKTGDSKAEINQLNRDLNTLRHNGVDENSDSVNLLKGRLAELTRELRETRAEIKAIGSETRAFDLFASSVKALVSIYEVGVGVTELFGEKNEDVEKGIKTLVAVQALANGVREIANQLTEKGTAANKVYTFFQNQVATAMDTTATATNRLKAALLTLGIGALIVGIGLLIANFKQIKNFINGVSKEQELLNDINEKAIDNYAKESSSIEVAVAKLKNENISRKEKMRTISQLQSEYPALLGNIKNEGELTEDLADIINNKLLPALSLKAKLQAAEEILVERQRAVVKRQIQLEEDLEKVRHTDFDKSDPVKNQQKRAAYYKKLEDYIKSGKDPELQYHKKRLDAVLEIIGTTNEELDKLGGDPKGGGFDFLEKQNKTTLELRKIREQVILDSNSRINSNDEKSEQERLLALARAERAQLNIIQISKQQELQNSKLTNDEKLVIEAKSAAETLKTTAEYRQRRIDLIKSYNERERKALLEIFVSEQLQLINANDAIIADEKTSFNKRTHALYDNYERRRAIIIAQYQDELKNTKITTEERIAIEKKYATDIQALTIDYGQQQLAIYKANQAAVTAAIEKEQQARKDNISKDESNVLRELNERYRNGNISVEQYEKERADIERKYRIISLKEEVNNAFAKVFATKEGTAERAAAEAELAKKTQELSDATTEKQIENEKRLTELKKQLASEAVETFKSFVEAHYDNEKNAIQEQIDALDKKKEKDIEVANSTITNEQDKAAAIQTINIRAQAQKEALERRQRQIDIDRARFEKAANIAQIIANTASAIVKQLVATPLPAGFPFIAAIGAIGALQLARAIATPIPKFEHGTNDAPGGLSLVGEKRSELVVTPDGKLIETPAMPTVMNVPKHSVIYPDSKRVMESGILSGLGRVPSLVDHKAYYKEMTASIDKGFDKIDRTIKRKREVHIKGVTGKDIIFSHGNNQINYLNSNLQG